MKAPMTFEDFKKHLDIIRTDMIYLGQCYDIGLDMYDKFKSVYDITELLSIIFKDDFNLIEQWVFDKDFAPVDSVEELYNKLMKGYNAWLKEECSPEK